MSVNKVILVGNLGKDPDLRYTPAGAAVVTFSMATTERYKDRDGNRQEKTEWHNIVAWRQLAEICGKFLHKGKQVYIEGKIQTHSYDDRDGNKKYITEIVADQMQMLGTKGDDQGSSYGGQQGNQSAPSTHNQGNQGNQGKPQNSYGGDQQTQPASPSNNFEEPTYNDDDEIPF